MEMFSLVSQYANLSLKDKNKLLQIVNSNSSLAQSLFIPDSYRGWPVPS